MLNVGLYETSFPRAIDSEDISVRHPTIADAPRLARLFSEMQSHYGFPVPDEKALQAARVACRPVESAFDPRVLIAIMDDEVVGSIVLNVTFPAFELSQSLYIRDLYVSRSARRCRVGQKLVMAAARLTFAEGFSALDWTTDAENAAARRMYESCGANALTRTYYRLTAADLGLSAHVST